MSEQDGQGDKQESVTVEVDRHVIDSADLSTLGIEVVGDGAIELVGEPDSVGFLPERVRVTGELTVERVGDDD